MKEAPSSASVAEIDPVAVEVLASSVTAPVPSLPASGASFAPVSETVTVCEVPSDADTEKVSSTDSSASRPCMLAP